MSAPKKGVVLSPQAEADVNDILLYTWQRWGDEQRDRYEATLDRAITALGDFPEIGLSVARLFPGSVPVLSNGTFFTIGSWTM